MADITTTETDATIPVIPTSVEEPVPSSESFEDVHEERKDVNSDEHLRKWTTFDFGGSHSDLDLIVEDTKFRVSKNVLSLASPVFDSMFHSDFKESGCIELQLPGKSAEIVHEFLRCIYPDTLSDITPKIALNILPLLEEYQVFQLKPRCESVLMGSIDDKTSTVDIFKLLIESCIYGLKILRARCVELASRKGKRDFDEARKEISIPPDALIEVLDTINSALEDKNASLQSKIMSNSDKLENEETLGLCMLAQMKNSVSVGLNMKLKWKEHVKVMNFAADKKINCCKLVSVWDTPHLFFVRVEDSYEKHPVYNKYRDEPMVTMEYLRVNTDSTYYLLHVTCMIVNRAGERPNYCVYENFECTADDGSFKEKLITLAALKDEDNGYVKDNKIPFVFLIYMSEPF